MLLSRIEQEIAELSALGAVVAIVVNLFGG